MSNDDSDDRRDGGSDERPPLESNEERPTSPGTVPRSPVDPDPDSNIGNDDRPRDSLGRPRSAKPVKRVDPYTLTTRVELVRQALIDGYHVNEIINWVKTDTNWDVEARQVKRYVAKALHLIRLSAARDRAAELGKAIARNDAVIRHAMRDRVIKDSEGKVVATHKAELKLVLAANIANARLMGLEAPVKHRHGNDPESPMPTPTVVAGDFVVLIQEVQEA